MLTKHAFYLPLTGHSPTQKKNPLFSRDSFEYDLLFGRKLVVYPDLCFLKPAINSILLRNPQNLLLDTLHRGEQQYISDGRGIRKQHYKTVDSDSDSACRRHTVLQGI